MKTHAINAPASKAKCFHLLDQVSRGALDEEEVTKRGRVVARRLPPHRPAMKGDAWHGFMRGQVTIPDDFDLTAPVFEGPWNAEEGVI